MLGNTKGLTSVMSFIQEEDSVCKALGLLEGTIYIANGQKATHVSSHSIVAENWNRLLRLSLFLLFLKWGCRVATFYRVAIDM